MKSEDLTRIAARHQVFLERYKTSTSRTYAASYKEYEKGLLAYLADIDFDKLSDLTKTQLRTVVRDLNLIYRGIQDGALVALAADFETFAGVEAGFEARSLNKVFAGVSTDITAITQPKAVSAALNNPMSVTGELLDPFTKTWTKRQSDAASGYIRKAWKEGHTYNQIRRNVRGTVAREFRDGMTAKQVRESATDIHTSLQHISSEARFATWEANSDVVDGYYWLSTIDEIVSAQCAALDGEFFKINEGPRPPLHYRAVLEGELVRTKRGEVPIEDVVVGDFVFTHMARWRRVTATMSRPQDNEDRAYELKDNLGGVTRLTGDHPVLCDGLGWTAVRDIKVGVEVFNCSHEVRHLEGACPRTLVKQAVLVNAHNIPTECTERLVSYKINLPPVIVTAPVKFNEAVSDGKIRNVLFNWLLKLKRNIIRFKVFKKQ